MTDEQNDKTPQYVTRLQTIERQVGEHVLAALEDPEAVAVLTTIASGLRADRVVSVPLSRDQVADITQILAQAQNRTRRRGRRRDHHRIPRHT